VIAEECVPDVAVARGRATLNQRVFRAAASITAAGVLVKLAATLKEIVVAAAFGRSDAMDAFLAAILIPNLLINVVAESMNQSLIPALVRVRMERGRELAQELLSSSLLGMVVLLTGAALAMAAAAHAIFPIVASNFPAGKTDLAIHLFYALLPYVVLGGIASICTGVLNSRERFALPALAPAMIPVSLIAATIALRQAMGIWALAVGTVGGAVLYAGLVASWMKPQGYSFKLRWHGVSEEIVALARQYAALLLSSVLASAGLLVDQGMAAMLPAGSLATLVYGGRFVGLAVTLIAGAISSAAAPYFSQLAVQKDWAGCRASVRAWALKAAMISIPVALAFIAGAHLLVRITLQHGAFTSRDTASVAPVLAMYALQIPFFAVSRVFYRFVIATRRTDLVLYCGLINLVLDIVLNIVLMRWMGVAGIALATSLWSVATFLFLGFWAWRLLYRAEGSAGKGRGEGE
jgi:putative peptidoglycan lipid II flippase